MKIVEIYKSEGKSEVAVSVISNGSLPSQRSVFGTVKNIENAVFEEKIQAPAIIVLGEVVNLQNDYRFELKNYLNK